MTSQAPDPPKRRMHRTITGSRVDLTELENVIQSASVRDADLETSSVSSTRSGGGRSNIIQIVPGKKNVKAAMRAALAEASGYGDEDLGMDSLNIASDEDDISLPDDASDTSTPLASSRSSSQLKHLNAASHPSEPLEGAGVVRRSYQESSAPPEGAGGYQTGEFVPPQVTEHKPLSVPRREPLGPGMHRSVTGSSVRLAELNDLVEKAGEAEPGTPGSRSGRTPRSQSNLSLGSRNSSIIQIVPGVKDIRSTLANAIADSQDGGSQAPGSQAPESTDPGGISERQSLGGPTTPGSMAGPQPFGTYKPRSIRRLMSEKSMTMDTVYSGLLSDDTPSDPLEGTGVVTGRKYVEAKHGPQYSQISPRDFPRVVNGVPMMASGEIDEEKRSSVPPSPLRKAGGVHRTISGSQMNLNELEAILEKATIPKSERQSLDGRSSTGASQTTHRSIVGSGTNTGRNSQVFGEEQRSEPTTTFGQKAKSFNSNDLQELIRRASVSRTEPDSPRSVGSASIPL